MITLHAFGRVHPKVHGLTRDLRVQWALEELGLPYQVRGWNHDAGETRSEAFRKLNPFLQLPVLEDDGFVLTETAAILLYLAEKAGALPADPQGRASITRWCFAALTTVEPVIQWILLADMGAFGDDATGERRATLVKTAGRGLSGLEQWLADHPYAAGAEFTVADILLTAVMRMAKRADLLAEYPRAEAYRARCEARPAWQRTLDMYEQRLGAKPGAAR